MPVKRPPTTEEVRIEIERLKNILMSRATGGETFALEYEEIRDRLLRDSRVYHKLPRFIKTCSNLDQFWNFIQPKFAHYSERRTYISNELDPILIELFDNEQSPGAKSTDKILEKVDAEHIRDAWEKARDRRVNDPSGAITAARTLLESVCKFILDEKNVSYHDQADLPKLYFEAASLLNLAPSQHSEKIFKQILGGSQAVVEGLGALRNRLGDAHGKGASSFKASPRHAELAVNLAGTMATFLIATWEAQKADPKKEIQV